MQVMQLALPRTQIYCSCTLLRTREILPAFSVFFCTTCMMLGTADVPKNVSGLYEYSAVGRRERQTLCTGVNVYLSALSEFINYFG
jgi:hypothetical protein